jgi:hypothetical protein
MIAPRNSIGRSEKQVSFKTAANAVRITPALQHGVR